jgi:hypothetical protein
MDREAVPYGNERTMRLRAARCNHRFCEHLRGCSCALRRVRKKSKVQLREDERGIEEFKGLTQAKYDSAHDSL